MVINTRFKFLNHKIFVEMKTEKFAKLAREFHAREKLAEEAARLKKKEDAEEEAFYDILGPSLGQHPCPDMIVCFPTRVPERLLQLVRKQDKIVLELRKPCWGDTEYQYIIHRRTNVL
jgi:hypothetical protein